MSDVTNVASRPVSRDGAADYRPLVLDAMDPSLTISAWIVVSVALTAGAVVQGVTGFGMVVLSLPVIVLVEPDLVPGPILVASAPLAIAVAVGDLGQARFSEVAPAFVGRAVGVVFGLALLAMFRAEALVLLAGGSVLAAVAVTAFVPPVTRTRTTLVIAGLLSGTFGTAVGIGGPPLALVYQGSRGPEIRGTLGMIMLTGLPIGIGSLALSGHLGWGEAIAGATLWPAIGIGFVLSRHLRANLETWIRPMVLAVSAFGAVVAITRTLVVA